MNIIIIGGSGLIGARLSRLLSQQGHRVNAASRATGVNAVTGEWLPQALAGADVVIDVTNAPSFEDGAVMSFFAGVTKNLLAAAATAGVQHYIALSVSGTERLQQSGYFRAKLAQEEQIINSGLPYTLLRATQFFEFIAGIAAAATAGQRISLPDALFQPVAADEVVTLLADIASAAPYNAVLDMAGPEKIAMGELIGSWLQQQGDTREVVTDAHARYFGSTLEATSLIPSHPARLGVTSFHQWLRAQEDAA